MKKLLSAILCAAVLAGCIPAAGALGTNDSAALGYSCGSIVKCGKSLFFAASSRKSGKTKLWLTTAHGKNARLVAKTPAYPGCAVFSRNGAAYYRKGEAMICVDPDSGKKQGELDLDPDDIYKEKNIEVQGLCPKGFVVRCKGDGLFLLGFDGGLSRLTTWEPGLKGCYTEFLCATDDSIFCYRTEKYSSKRYKSRLYRADLGAESLTAEALGSFTSQKKPSGAPENPCASVLGKKIAFVLSTASGEGCAYCMNPDGSGLKKLGEKLVSGLTPGKGCAYVASAVSDYQTLFKITFSGGFKKAVVCKNVKYPALSYTTSTGCALGIKMSSEQEFGCDLYSLPEVRAAAGKRVVNADSLVKDSDTGYIALTPSIKGSSGDLALVAYTVSRYDRKGRFEKILRENHFIVNARSGNKIQID